MVLLPSDIRFWKSRPGLNRLKMGEDLLCELYGQANLDSKV